MKEKFADFLKPSVAALEEVELFSTIVPALETGLSYLYGCTDVQV
jgi:hypothetical protein